MDVHKLCFRLFVIFELVVLYCNCQPTTLTPVDPDVVEGSDITFVCTVSSAVRYVSWLLSVDTTSSITYTGVQNGACALSPSTSILSDTTKYSYTCNNTVYQVTVKNVQRSQHYDVWSCYPQGESSVPISTINVHVPVSAVSITPASTTVDVLENRVKEFTCQTSASRPDASVTWYKVESGATSQINQNITSSTTNADFSVTTSTLRFVPSRQQDGVQIFCKAENTVNTSPKQSDRRTLNVLYRADNPVITEGNEYRVIENSQGQLSCTVSGGNPTPTLTPTVSDSSNSGVITKILTWTAVRGSDTTCSCASQQTGFSDSVVSVNVVILYPPTPPQFKVNGNIINGDVSFIVGKTRSIQCVSDSKPSPSSYKWTGPKTNDGQNITFNAVQKIHSGQYTCEVKNTMNPSTGGSIPGSSSSSVNLVVLYRAYNPVITEGNEYRVIENSQGQLTCTVIGGNPTPTLTWNCNSLSPTESDSSNNGVITKILTWTAVRGSDTICSCTSQQTGFEDRVVSVNVDILQPTTLASTIRTPTTKKVLPTHEQIPSTSESTGKPENEVIQLLHAMHQEVIMKLDSCIKATNRLVAAEEERNRVLNRLVDAIINIK